MSTDKKTCFRCGIEKSRSDFYAHSRMADGLLGKCKGCTKQDSNKRRREKYEEVKAYDRRRGNLPHRVAARHIYSKTEAARESHKKSLAACRAKYPEKYEARYMLDRAVRSGEVNKPDACMFCGSDGRIHGHHSCYDMPLDVTWLCAKCHGACHAMTNTILRGDKLTF